MDLKEQIQRTLRRLGFVVRKLESSSDEYQVIKDTLRASRADVVLDVGANIGQYGDLVLETGFAGDLISFEAIPKFMRAWWRTLERAIASGLSRRARRSGAKPARR